MEPSVYPETIPRIIVSAVCEKPNIDKALRFLENKIQRKLDSLSDHAHQYRSYAKSFPQRIILKIEARGYEPKPYYELMPKEAGRAIPEIHEKIKEKHAHAIKISTAYILIDVLPGYLKHVRDKIFKLDGVQKCDVVLGAT
ncbi:MAG: hypothetical protein QXH91_02380 [Candidatus Bathyarchaeia archaeon]